MPPLPSVFEGLLLICCWCVNKMGRICGFRLDLWRFQLVWFSRVLKLNERGRITRKGPRFVMKNVFLNFPLQWKLNIFATPLHISFQWFYLTNIAVQTEGYQIFDVHSTSSSGTSKTLYYCVPFKVVEVSPFSSCLWVWFTFSITLPVVHSLNYIRYLPICEIKCSRSAGKYYHKGRDAAFCWKRNRISCQVIKEWRPNLVPSFFRKIPHRLSISRRPTVRERHATPFIPYKARR